MRGFRATVALLVAGSAVAGVVAAVALTGSRASFDDVVIVLAVAAYAAVGTAVELARPGHLVGRLMLVGALAWGVGEGLLAWGLTALDQTPGSATAALLGVLGTAARGCGWLVLVLALPLVFPDGRSPSRTATRLVVTAVTAFTVASLAAPVPLENRMATVDNPIGLPESWQVVADLLAIASLAVAFVALLVVVRAMIGRWRTGDELVRQQVVVFGIAFALPLLVLPLAGTPASRPWMFALSALPVPVAVAVAMFQRRLYDVQLVASRTLTYVALSALAGRGVRHGRGRRGRDAAGPGRAVAAARCDGRGRRGLRSAARLGAGPRQPRDVRALGGSGHGLGRHRPSAGGLRRLGRPARRADHRDGRGPGLLLRRDPRHPRSGPGRQRARGSADRPPATDGVRTRRRRAAAGAAGRSARSTGSCSRPCPTRSAERCTPPVSSNSCVTRRGGW